jgi:hypothetical protein
MRPILFLSFLLVLETGLRLSPLFAQNQFQFVQRPVVLDEGGQLTQYAILARGYEFVFLPPENWKLSVDEAKNRIVFTSRDRPASLSFAVNWDLSKAASQVGTSDLRKMITERFPDSTILEEFTSYANNSQGPTFDISFRAPANQMWTRIFFLRFSGGSVEFAVTSSVENFKSCQLTFGHFLNSIRISPLQKRTDPPGPDRARK